jgi:hypothetical protein
MVPVSIPTLTPEQVSAEQARFRQSPPEGLHSLPRASQCYFATTSLVVFTVAHRTDFEKKRDSAERGTRSGSAALNGTLKKSSLAGIDGVSLVTAGEHKGFGLSLAVEILGGILSGTGPAGPGPGLFANGTLIICLDMERFVPLGGAGGRQGARGNPLPRVAWCPAEPRAVSPRAAGRAPAERRAPAARCVPRRGGGRGRLVEGAIILQSVAQRREQPVCRPRMNSTRF